MIQSGRLMHPIEVQILTDVVNEFGKTEDAYLNVYHAKANCQIISGTELLKSGMELSREFISILARYDRRLKQHHFILWNNARYSIDMINPDDRNLQMIINASREF